MFLCSRFFGVHFDDCLQYGIFLREKQILFEVFGSSVTYCILVKQVSADSDEDDEDDEEDSSKSPFRCFRRRSSDDRRRDS